LLKPLFLKEEKGRFMTKQSKQGWKSASIAQHLHSVATTLADDGIESESDFAALREELSEVRTKLSLVTNLDDLYFSLLKKFRSLECMMYHGEHLFLPYEVAPLLGYEPLPDFTAPEYDRILEGFCCKHAIADELNECIRPAMLTAHGVSILIRNSEFPAWIRQKLETWLRAYSAEVKAGHLCYQ
jgi:hypothetical protein